MEDNECGWTAVLGIGECVTVSCSLGYYKQVRSYFVNRSLE